MTFPSLTVIDRLKKKKAKFRRICLQIDDQER